MLLSGKAGKVLGKKKKKNKMQGALSLSESMGTLRAQQQGMQGTGAECSPGL